MKRSSLFSNANEHPTSVAELLVTVTPVQKLVVDYVRHSPHREYQIEISEDEEGNVAASSGNGVGISSSYSKRCDHKHHNSRIITLRIKTQVRFSSFHNHFTSMQHLLTRKSQGLIPPKGTIWDDYTHSMDNVLGRARRMQLYLWDVLNSNGPAILRSHQLQKALSLSARDRQLLLDIAERREVKAQKVHNETKSPQDRSKDEQEERNLWNLAQTLNVTNPETRSSLKFQPHHQPMEFELYRKWVCFGGNERSVLGGRKGIHKKQTWFQLERTDFPQLNPFSALTYQLRTMKGVSLLEMKERFRKMVYVCDLSYVTANGQRVPALTVQQQFQLGGLAGEDVNIIGRGPLAKTRFECEGPWLQETIRVDGRFAGVLDQHFLSLADVHTLTVAPNQDCLLVLGIACAVVRIHAARQDE